MGGPLTELLTPELGYLAIVVVLAVGIQTAIGFGAMLVCVTMGAWLWSVPELTAMLLPLTTMQTVFIVVRHRRHVAWRLLFRQVFPWMGAGLLVSLALVGSEEQAWMRPALGVMVFGLGARELWRARGAQSDAPRSPVAARGMLVIGGLVHGVFATGGPALVWALGQEGLDKAPFRVTLTAVFVGVNSVMVGTFLLRGQIDAGSATRTGLLLVPMVIGLLAGEWLHDHVEERPFRLAVWACLTLAAVPLIAPALF